MKSLATNGVKAALPYDRFYPIVHVKTPLANHIAIYHKIAYNIHDQ
jgi:hypothetical protein